MRTIPGMTILNPADDVEARAAVEAAIQYEGPVYLRFGRLATPIFNDPATYQLLSERVSPCVREQMSHWLQPV